MVKVEAVIHPSRLDEVKATLDRIGITNVLITQAQIRGDLPETRGNYRGCPVIIDLPRWKVELIISSLQVDEVVDAILSTGRTELPGDQDTVAIFELADAIRINSRRRVGLASS